MESQETFERSRAAKRVALNMKATPALRAAIDRAAEESGLSIAQEVERRLMDSLKEEDALGGRRTADLSRTISALIMQIEEGAGGRWFKSETCWAAVANMLPRVLASLRPAPDNADQLMEEAMDGAKALALADQACETFNQQRMA